MKENELYGGKSLVLVRKRHEGASRAQCSLLSTLFGADCRHLLIAMKKTHKDGENEVDKLLECDIFIVAHFLDMDDEETTEEKQPYDAQSQSLFKRLIDRIKRFA